MDEKERERFEASLSGEMVLVAGNAIPASLKAEREALEAELRKPMSERTPLHVPSRGPLTVAGSAGASPGRVVQVVDPDVEAFALRMKRASEGGK